MSIFWRREKISPLDGQINAILEEMRLVGVYSSEYPALMTNLERLIEMKTRESRNEVSRDTIALIAGNLMGILLIVAYEQKHVMTSKGFSQIIQPKRLH